MGAFFLVGSCLLDKVAGSLLYCRLPSLSLSYLGGTRFKAHSYHLFFRKRKPDSIKFPKRCTARISKCTIFSTERESTLDQYGGRDGVMNIVRSSAHFLLSVNDDCPMMAAFRVAHRVGGRLQKNKIKYFFYRWRILTVENLIYVRPTSNGLELMIIKLKVKESVL